MVRDSSIRTRFLTGLFLWATSWLFLTCLVPKVVASPQVPEPDTNSNTSVAAPSPSPTPIPPSSIVDQSEAVTARIKEIQSFLNDTQQNAAIREAIPELQRQVGVLSAESDEALRGRPTLEDLKPLERKLQGPTATVDGWKWDLASQITEVDKRIEELRGLKGLWQRSLDKMTAAPVAGANTEPPEVEQVPDEILQVLRDTIRLISETQTLAENSRAGLLTLQTNIADIESQIAAVTSQIKERRASALSNLFVREDVPVWNIGSRTAELQNIPQQLGDAMTSRWTAFSEYAAKNIDRFIIHGALIALFAGVLVWLRRRIAPLVAADRKLERAANIFRHPIAAALILSIFFSTAIYPQAPQLLSAALGAFAMVPVVIILRRLVDRPVFTIIYVLVAFYFFDRIRDVSTDIPLLSRMLFLVEMLAAVCLLSYFRWSKRISRRVQAGHQTLFETLRRIVLVAIVVFSVAFFADLIGAVNLSYIIGNGILRSLYLALILYTAAEVIDSLTVFVLRVTPLSRLGMVRNNRKVIRGRVRTTVRWLGFFLWIYGALSVFSIKDLVLTNIQNVFGAELNLGALKLSLAHVAAFVVAVWVAVMISRFLRFVLEEDVYPRVDMGPGVSYAVSTIVHYVVLIIGIILALLVLGFEVSQFAIVAGAVGLGVGFGLQNIINNFVSGIILLFERPVKVGDMVQVGSQQGTLSQIGLRASILRKVDGSDVIIPNGELISGEVINWTMSDDKRRLDIPVGVAYGSDPDRVLDILSSVATANNDILVEPPPRGLFLAFGDSSLDFELRAWTDNSDDWVSIRSALVSAVYAALNEADIEIPFPQRDLHLRSTDQDMIKDVKGV